MDFAEEIRDFLIESNENLAALDQQIVELEKNPTDEKLIASVFRTIHTVKGTSGFFGFKVLGSIAHVAENILGQVREKQRPLTPELVSLVLQTMDAIRAVLAEVEANGVEGEDVYQDLRSRLDDAYHYRGASAGEAAAASAAGPDAPVLESSASAAGSNASHGNAEAEHAVVTEAAPTPASIVPMEEAVASGAPVPAAAVEPFGRRADDSAAANSTIRVDVALLDKLMNLVGELVLARNQILQGPESGNTSGTAQRLNLITSELQEGVMRTRMQPIGMVWNKLPRVVRDLASSLGKKIEMQMEGAETELDKTIIEAIKDPLTHIVRNSCDHGIEMPEARLAKGKSAHGTILLRAFHEGGHVNIEISDDGAGIDPEKIKAKAIQKGLVRPEQAAAMNEWEALRLIFLPGFSTAEAITSISGRGVGMDVVKTNIEKISGSVDLSNRVGAGSTIKIKIPLTLAIIPGLIVSLKGSLKGAPHIPPGEDGELVPVNPDQRFVIPQANLLELVRLEGEKDRRQIETINGAEVYRRRGKLLPLAYLSEVLGLTSGRQSAHGEGADAEPNGVLNIVVVQAEETAFGLVVDQVNDTQEIVVKALGKQLKALDCYVGATIMGDGRIALILDVTGIAKLAHMLPQPLERGRSEGRPAGEGGEKKQMLLLFRSGKFPRLVLPLSLVARLEEFPIARIEYAAGAPVLRYREAILPLIWLSRLLDPDAAPVLLAPVLLATDVLEKDVLETDHEAAGESLQVIVFSEGDRFVGIVVDEILDIVDDAVTIRRPSAARGLLGSGVVGGKVTDFVDLGALLEAARGSAAGSLASSAGRGRRLLLVDSARMARGVLRSYLEIHGHHVAEVSSVEEAVDHLEHELVDVVLAGVHAGEPESGMLRQRLRARFPVNPPAVPLIALTGEGKAARSGLDKKSFDTWVEARDRAAILLAIEALAGAQAGKGSEPGGMALQATAKTAAKLTTKTTGKPAAGGTAAGADARELVAMEGA